MTQRTAARPTEVSAAAAVTVAPPAARRTRWQAIWRRRQLALGALLVAAICLGGIFAPLLTSSDPIEQNLPERIKPPVWSDGGTLAHPLGTDAFGRDTLSRLLYGARYSLAISVVAVVLSGLLGVIAGVVAGYYGGPMEAIIMRAGDAQQALPSVLLAIVVVALFGNSLLNLTLVLAVTGWAVYSRILFGTVRQLRAQEFVTAAVCLGATPLRIIWRQILPNTLSPIIVISTLQIGRMILLEAGLSFLGLGVPQPLPAWGSMLADGQRNIFTSPWLATIPGLAITLTVWSVNLLGDDLRRALDPRSRTAL